MAKRNTVSLLDHFVSIYMRKFDSKRDALL